ncbi:MAG: class I SAM-dependent methyltransferase, partial [Nitrospirae bacterium]|nr:class I SAM-dependent methyltransferase [Nitrospirota bacterium]
GVFPILDHYHEPFWTGKGLSAPLDADRPLPGVDLNVNDQLDRLRQFRYAEELRRLPLEKPAGPAPAFYYHNGAFESGDAEYFYSLIRLHKPATIIEVGAGHSTLLAREAIARNQAEVPGYRCVHLCIEPYENPWLERCGVEVIREPLERVDRRLFLRLSRNDMLFIDSSHVIKPQGDVVTAVLSILPALASGVLVHLHDIFTPKDYPADWVVRDVKLWNEQYLLEAFLSHNSTYAVIGAVNYLAHHHADLLGEHCPVFRMESARREPGSFWIMKR